MLSKVKERALLDRFPAKYDKMVERNSQILKIIIETIILCGNQNMALRGHEEDMGNFIALLKYRSKDNKLLQEH